jgi:hypothetical protein
MTLELQTLYIARDYPAIRRDDVIADCSRYQITRYIAIALPTHTQHEVSNDIFYYNDL